MPCAVWSSVMVYLLLTAGPASEPANYPDWTLRYFRTTQSVGQRILLYSEPSIDFKSRKSVGKGKFDKGRRGRGGKLWPICLLPASNCLDSWHHSHWRKTHKKTLPTISRFYIAEIKTFLNGRFRGSKFAKGSVGSSLVGAETQPQVAKKGESINVPMQLAGKGLRGGCVGRPREGGLIQAGARDTRSFVPTTFEKRREKSTKVLTREECNESLPQNINVVKLKKTSKLLLSSSFFPALYYSQKVQEWCCFHGINCLKWS